MFSTGNGSEVLDFDVVLRVQDLALGISPSGERSLNLHGGVLAQGKLIICVMCKLQPQIVDGARAEDLRVADLDVVLGLLGVVALRRQGELADAVILAVGVKELIARGEGVVRGQLVIQRGSSDSCSCWDWAPPG